MEETNKKRIINIIHNNDMPSTKAFKSLHDKLSRKDYEIYEGFNPDAILNICIGGDGAFLRTVHRYHFPDIPFIGVNTGHLGFFQEISPDNLDKFVDKFCAEEYNIEEISLIQADICTRDACITLNGINEIVIKAIESRVIHLNIYIDNEHFEKVSGDGVIISTPIGSTAYNYSCGGSVISPSLNVLQLTPIAPINSKSYRCLNNSLIIPKDTPIVFSPEYRDENSVLIIVDGKQFTYDNISEISFSFSEKTLKRLTLNKKNFWANVRDKFL
ncbi:inorganic polyphosphate/ATP-NAD kinase PpnK [Gottschalkia acidurici 9a]|uniref:NAD kinase n=1 Tax=Gottschalkia acidurici (strain ATCC 7906 / DSM 604 / BCRC 14475 / CIP 104303 / KCTC 5404 / NCIMB 10678 / 9a) TaxID=1128398 RepID=K0B027_GOTA9|nr:NAD(+)/NADH kinase [Gottschalkia acidurici]AFS77981.1 inorganic polyphosphate/ATP-NAD kinase PpnK [Gottschalkia acidurici 9a]